MNDLGPNELRQISSPRTHSSVNIVAMHHHGSVLVTTIATKTRYGPNNLATESVPDVRDMETSLLALVINRPPEPIAPVSVGYVETSCPEMADDW